MIRIEFRAVTKPSGIIPKRAAGVTPMVSLS